MQDGVRKRQYYRMDHMLQQDQRDSSAFNTQPSNKKPKLTEEEKRQRKREGKRQYTRRIKTIQT